MLRTVLGWLAWLEDRDIEGTALSFVVCQLTLAIAASTGAWVAGSEAAVMLFLPTVLLAAFFLRVVDGSLVLVTAFVATWYFIVPPYSSFALDTAGAVKLGIFIVSSILLVLGVVGMRRLLRRRPTFDDRLLQTKGDLIADG